MPFAFFKCGLKDSISKHIIGQYGIASIYTIYSILFSSLVSLLAGIPLFILLDTKFGKVVGGLNFITSHLSSELM